MLAAIFLAQQRQLFIQQENKKKSTTNSVWEDVVCCSLYIYIKCTWNGGHNSLLGSLVVIQNWNFQMNTPHHKSRAFNFHILNNVTAKGWILERIWRFCCVKTCCGAAASILGAIHSFTCVWVMFLRTHAGIIQKRKKECLSAAHDGRWRHGHANLWPISSIWQATINYHNTTSSYRNVFIIFIWNYLVLSIYVQCDIFFKLCVLFGLDANSYLFCNLLAYFDLAPVYTSLAIKSRQNLLQIFRFFLVRM